MKAYLINMHLLVPSSRSSAKVKVKYKSNISQKMAVSGAFVFHKHIFFFCRLHVLTIWTGLKSHCLLTFPKLHISDSERACRQQFLDMMKVAEKFSEQVENVNLCGKGEIAPYKQFLLFPQCFQKTCTADM